MEKLLLKQGKPCNRNIKKMEPIQGNPCSLNRFSPCNVCFCFDFYDFFSLHDFPCFTKNSDLHGFPCIGINFFIFQLQGFPCFNNTFFLFWLYYFPVLLAFFPCLIYRGFPVLIKTQIYRDFPVLVTTFYVSITGFSLLL